MDEIKVTARMVTREEFDKAVESVVHKQADDLKIKEAGTAGLVMGLAGVMFASMLKRELFGEE